MVMKHKCTKCGTLYDKESEVLTLGCMCGNNRFYFYNEKQTKVKTTTTLPTVSFDIEDEEYAEYYSFDTESINILGDGKYEIDINNLMNTPDSVVYKYGDGKYSINIEDQFKQAKKR